MPLEISLQNALCADHAPRDAQFQSWVYAALQAIQKDSLEGEIVIRIVTLEESAELNESFRHKKGPTNVLSFTYEEDDIFYGDLAICADLVAREADEQAKPIIAHWAHLVIHGILHLMGYDHEADSEAQIMESLEIQIMATLSYPNPYD